jgi:hypothetical protein
MSKAQNGMGKFSFRQKGKLDSTTVIQIRVFSLML